MLTKTKIALSSALIFGFASAAVAQQMGVDPSVGSRGYVESAPFTNDQRLGGNVAPGFNDRSGNAMRDRDDFTGSAPRDTNSRYADQPGNN